MFNHPHAVFTEEMLRPELQDMDIFADGMDNIVATQKRVAKMYFDDGSIAQACPPLKALLHIMLNDEWEGKGLDHPEFRKLFTREYLLASDWYAARLAAKQKIDRQIVARHVEYLDKFLKRASHADEAARLGIADRLSRARRPWRRSNRRPIWTPCAAPSARNPSRIICSKTNDPLHSPGSHSDAVGDSVTEGPLMSAPHSWKCGVPCLPAQTSPTRASIVNRKS